MQGGYSFSVTKADVVLRGVSVPAKVLEGGYLNEGALEHFWREYLAFVDW